MHTDPGLAELYRGCFQGRHMGQVTTALHCTALHSPYACSLHNGGGCGWGEVINGGFGLVLDGSMGAARWGGVYI